MSKIYIPKKYRIGKIKHRGAGEMMAGTGIANPSQLSGLVTWFKADAITGLSDGAAVTTWPDSSPQGNNITQGTAGKRPLYKVNIKNGNPAVLFDGTDDDLTTTTATGLPSGQQYTLFLVASVFDTGVERMATDFRSTGTSNSILGNIGQHFAGIANNQLYLLHRDTGNGGLPQSVQGAQVTGWRIFEATWDGTTGRLYVNGTEQGSGSAFSQSVTGLDSIIIGSNTSGKFWKDYIAELVLYNNFKISPQRAYIRNYLNRKYAVF